VIERALVLAKTGVIAENEVQLKARPELGKKKRTELVPLSQWHK
jgi:hypothetical protein